MGILRMVACALLLLCCMSCDRGAKDAETAVDFDLLIGAHYYLWYPSNFGQGFVRQKLVPPQKPALGIYNSTDMATIRQHIQWAHDYGIDFFTLDWWPRRKGQNKAIDTFVAAPNIGDIKFCIFYESQELNFLTDVNATYFDEKTVATFVSQLNDIAEKYFHHPSYLRINGRPVIYMYLTRTWAGDYARALQEVRANLKAKGFDPYIIGDEIFWGIIPQGLQRQDLPAATGDPQVERARLFDALTAYNLYDQTKETFRGYGRHSAFLKDSLSLYRRYKEHPDIQRPVFPTVLPGYNDRGVRLHEDHFAIPRAWDEQSGEGSYFSHAIDQLIKPLMKTGPRLFFITSFNEWNEDTSIEPIAKGAATTRDSSSTGTVYTQGYSYSGYGMTNLEIVREKRGDLSGPGKKEHSP